ncbi:hypothetical protein LKF24_2172 [Lactococcus lactis subsp. lactis]|nr:hypothetical protein LKF24_2172 [Lactococcus lactis subsp. lactis]
MPPPDKASDKAFIPDIILSSLLIFLTIARASPILLTAQILAKTLAVFTTKSLCSPINLTVSTSFWNISAIQLAISSSPCLPSLELNALAIDVAASDKTGKNF